MPDKHYQTIEVYNKLYLAAERIGKNNYKIQASVWKKTHGSLRNFRFQVTSAHKELIDTMRDLINGDIGWEDAILVLYNYENMKERFR